jgi:hypothetical protein
MNIEETSHVIVVMWWSTSLLKVIIFFQNKLLMAGTVLFCSSEKLAAPVTGASKNSGSISPQNSPH